MVGTRDTHKTHSYLCNILHAECQVNGAGYQFAKSLVSVECGGQERFLMEILGHNLIHEA